MLRRVDWLTVIDVAEKHSQPTSTQYYHQIISFLPYYFTMILLRSSLATCNAALQRSHSPLQQYISHNEHSNTFNKFYVYANKWKTQINLYGIKQDYTLVRLVHIQNTINDWCFVPLNSKQDLKIVTHAFHTHTHTHTHTFVTSQKNTVVLITAFKDLQYRQVYTTTLTYTNTYTYRNTYKNNTSPTNITSLVSIQSSIYRWMLTTVVLHCVFKKASVILQHRHSTVYLQLVVTFRNHCGYF